MGGVFAGGGGVQLSGVVAVQEDTEKSTHRGENDHHPEGVVEGQGGGVVRLLRRRG